LDREKAISYKVKFGFQACYTDMFQMLANEKPDAVCIIVPEQFMCSTSIAVMELGYPVLLEKPPGLYKDETLRMIATAKKAGVINQVAFNRRHMPLITKLKEEMGIHAPDAIQCIFYDFFRFDRRDEAFETTAIHGIDAVKHIIGSEYQEVLFSYQEMPLFGKNVANLMLDCLFKNGVAARINFCPCAGAVVERACVNAKDHTFFLQTPIWNGFDTPGELVHVEKGKLASRVFGQDLGCGSEMFETNGFYDENVSFFENVRMSRPSRDDIQSALQAVEIAESIALRKRVWSAGAL
jgi:predicted dehydrogenase